MVIIESPLEKSVGQSEADKQEAIRLSKDIHSYVQPLLDWYQFASGNHLSHYIKEICNIRGLNVTYPQVRHFVSGKIKQSLDDSLRWIHSVMRRMYEPTIEGRREEIPIKLKVKYVLPNDEPLNYLIERALSELIGEVDEKAKKHIEAMLKSKKLGTPSSLVDGVKRHYGFASETKAQEFLSDLAELDSMHYLIDLEGSRNVPSNYHRKTFAVAAVLDYAWKNGFKDKAVEAILERGRKRSLKKREHVIYLTVSRSKYMSLIRAMKSKGLERHVLAVVMSQVLSMNVEDTENNYMTGRNDFMGLDYYLKLEEFVKNALPNIRVVDLSSEKNRQMEFDAFLRLYRGGRVLIVYAGPKNKQVTEMAQKIRNDVLKKIGRPFLFDPHNVVGIGDVERYDRILADSKYA